jgi:hypothetical protein
LIGARVIFITQWVSPSIASEKVMSHDFESEMTAHWLQSDIGPRQAAAKLQPVCGDVEPLSEQAIRELEAEWQEKRNAFYAVLGILGGPWNCLAGFDCEDVESPADHTRVVSYLAKATNGRFVVDGTTQTIEPNGDLTLNLLHRGNRYSCTFEDGGSWVNLSGLLAGLNN